MPDDARFGVAFGRGIGLRDIDPACHVDVAARRILMRGARASCTRPVEMDLSRERLEGGQRGEHQAEAVARRIRHRALRASGHEERWVGLLDTDREHFILPRNRRCGSPAPDAWCAACAGAPG